MSAPPDRPVMPTKAGTRSTKAPAARPPKAVDDPNPRIRLGNIIVWGAKLKASVAEAVTSADLSWSTDETAQLALTVSDPGFAIWRAAEFTKSAAVTYRESGFPELRFRISAITLDGGTAGTGGFQVNARSEGWWKLKRMQGPKVMRHASPSQFVEAECKAAGLKAVVQPSATRAQVARDVKPQGTGAVELAAPPSSWSTFQRLASELGFYMFEFAGTVYFGQPSWLIAHGDVIEVTLPLRNTPEVWSTLTMPSINMSDDSDVPVEISDINLPEQRFKECRPGKALRLRGLPPFEDKYLVTSMSMPLLGPGSITLGAATPVNPAPQPPSSGSSGAGGSLGSGSVRVPPVGSLTVKGARATQAQLANATTIYQVGRSMGMSEQAIRIAIAAAIQESVLQNLKGGDRDSAGLFQQRPSAGWGTLAQVTDPAYAARKFFTALQHVPGWQNMSLTQAAQAVQRSAYPNAYAQWSAEAGRIVDAIQATATSGGGSGGATQSGTKSALDFVRVAMSASNARYVYGAEASISDPTPSALDCSELVQWALGRVGITFPDGSYNQQDAVRGVSIATALRTRGALLFWGNPAHHVGISLGDGLRTMEARNPSAGVGVFRAADIAWTTAGLVPGLRYQ